MIGFSHSEHTTVVCWGGGLNKYHTLQLTAYSVRWARSRFRARLMPSVAMTSNVKSWSQLFSGHHDVFVLGASEEAEPGRSDG